MLRSISSAALIGIALTASACDDDNDDGGSPSRLVQVSPAPGAYQDDITVTLTAGTQATIHYTLDGTTPVPFGANTTTAMAPVTIPLTANANEQVVYPLRFVTTNQAGNVIESERTLEYRIDKKDPVITAPATIPDPLLLEPTTVQWSADEPVDWQVAVGEDGKKLTIEGSATQGEIVTFEIPGIALAAGATNVPVKLSVTDLAGRSGMANWTISQPAWPVVQVLIDVESVELSQDGSHAFVAGGNRWLSIDLAQQQVEHNLLLPSGVAAQEKAGDRLYLAAGDILRVDPATGTVANTIPTNGRATALASNEDGSRLYYSDLAGVIGFVDTSNDSLHPLTGQSQLTRSNMHFLSPQRELLYSWQSQGIGLESGVRTFDVDTGLTDIVPVPSTRFLVPVDPNLDWIYLREEDVSAQHFLARYTLGGERLAQVDIATEREWAAAPQRILLTAEPGSSILEIRSADDLLVDVAYPLNFGAQGGAEELIVESVDGRTWLFWLGVDRVLRVIPIL